MGNIKQYENPIAGLQPSDRGVSAAVNSGQAWSGALNSIGQDIGSTVATVGAAYNEHEARMEISTGAAQAAQLQSTLDKRWNETAANFSLDDETTPDAYRQTVLEPALQDFKDSFKTKAGKQWAETWVASTREHMFNKTAADQATRSGQAVVNNLGIMQTHLTNTVAEDPTSLNQSLGTLASAVPALIPMSVTPAARTAIMAKTRDMQIDLVKSAIGGMIERNPEAAKKDIQEADTSEYLTSTEKHGFLDMADRVIAHNAEQAKANAAALLAQQKTATTRAGALLSVSMFQPDGTLQMPSDFYEGLRTLATMPGADPGEIRSLENMAKGAVEDAAKGKPVVSDPHTYADFAARMSLPVTDPHALANQEIYEARASGRLSNEDMSFFVRATDDIHKDPSMSQARSDIERVTSGFKSSITDSNPYLGMVSPAQDQLYLQFQQEINGRFAILMKDGKSASEAATILTDPRNPQYIGSQVTRYTMTKDAAMALMMKQMQSTGIGVLPSRAPNAQAGTGTLKGAPGTGIPLAPTAPTAPPTDFPKIKPGETMDQLMTRINAYKVTHAGQ